MSEELPQDSVTDSGNIPSTDTAPPETITETAPPTEEPPQEEPKPKKEKKAKSPKTEPQKHDMKKEFDFACADSRGILKHYRIKNSSMIEFDDNLGKRHELNRIDFYQFPAKNPGKIVQRVLKVTP